jgi:hypothetical protein
MPSKQQKVTNDDYYVDDTEPLLSVDKFYQPLVATGKDYATLLITRLILMEPGLNQLRPDMGVGLVSRYRYATDADMDRLNKDIANQIQLYLPQFTLTNVRCELGTVENSTFKTINIYITTDELNMYIPVNPETGEVIQTKPTLRSLK